MKPTMKTVMMKVSDTSICPDKQKFQRQIVDIFLPIDSFMRSSSTVVILLRQFGVRPHPGVIVKLLSYKS